MSGVHTPGPWCVVLGKNISVSPVAGGQRVALCNYDNGPIEKANARLMADSPAMLALLIRALPTVEHMYHTTLDADGSLWADVEAMRAMIAKHGATP